MEEYTLPAQVAFQALVGAVSLQSGRACCSGVNAFHLRALSTSRGFNPSSLNTLGYFAAIRCRMLFARPHFFNKSSFAVKILG
jgi:hypothetical protein